MKAIIDSEGRIEIPKEMRDEAGLEPGMEVEIRCREGHLEVEATEGFVRLERRGQFLVGVRTRPGPPLTQEIVNDTIEAIREERYRAALGLDADPE